MNSDEIKHRYNLVAIIAAIGAIIALAGLITMYMEFSGRVRILDILVYGLLVFIALNNIRPSVDTSKALITVVIGVLAVVVTGMVYYNLAEDLGAASFTDVGIGIWMMFAGTIVFTIFSISDYLYKKKQ